MQKKIFLIVFSLLGLTCAVVITLFFGKSFNSRYNPLNTNPNSSQTAVNREQFETKSSSFAQANELINTDPAQANELYKTAAADATIQGEVDQVQFGIANATFLSGNKAEGIRLLKEIAASSTAQRISRGYAIQFMANYYNTTADKEVFELIFSDEPYASFKRIAGEEKREAIKQLIKYGLSFYPLPILNLRLAAIENDTYVELKNATPTDETLLNQSKTVIIDAVNAADRSIQTLIGTDNADQLPQIYNLKGLVLANMIRAGDSSLGNPAEAFNTALEYEQQYPNTKARLFILFNYLLFLSSTDYGNNEVKINELIEDIKTVSQTNDSLTSYIANLNRFDYSFNSQRMAELAERNVKFKEILVSAGWNL